MVSDAVFWAATIVYLGITLFLAYIAYKQTKKGEQFLLGNRQVHPFIIGLSYGSTFISTAAIVGFGGVAAQLGEGLIWLTVLNIGVGILIAFVIYGKQVRKLGKKLQALTFPDLMGKRFKSPFLQYSTAFLIVIMMPIYAAAVLIGGAIFIEETLGIDYNTALISFAILTAVYVLFGGLLAVMYTDAFQASVMLFGMTAVLIITLSLVGGFTAGNETLNLMASDPTISAKFPPGMTGWTSFPELGSNLWFTMVTTIIMGVGIGVLAQPQLVVRFMTAKDGKSLNRAVVIGGIFILMMTGVAFTIGALTNAYFWEETSQTAIAAAGGVDNVIPYYINQAMPDWLIVIFMLTLLAAAMSTLSALLHTMGSAAGHDLWCHIAPSRLLPKNWRKEVTECSLNANRYGTMIMIVASVSVALLLPNDIIARATAMFMGLCASAFLPMFTYGIFSKRPSALAGKLSLVVGASVWFFWTAFVHIKESDPLGLCEWIFGKPALLEMPWQVIDPLIIAMPLAILALAIGWYFDPARKEAPIAEAEPA